MAVTQNDLLVGPLTPAAGVTTISLDFFFERGEWLEVYSSVRSSALVLGADYTVTGEGSGSGTVQLTTPANGTDRYAIFLAVPLQRSSDMQARGEFKSEPFNIELDRIWQRLQLNSTRIRKSIKLKATSSLNDLTIDDPVFGAVAVATTTGWTNGPQATEIALAQTAAVYAALGSGFGFSSVAAYLADSIVSYTAGAGKVVVSAGTYLVIAGRRFLVAASGAVADVTVQNANGVKLYDLARRTAAAAAINVLSGDGAIVMMDGLLYRVDATATGTASATFDLGVNGFRHHGLPQVLHYGAKPNYGNIQANTDAIDRAIAACGGVLYVNGFFPTYGGHLQDGVKIVGTTSFTSGFIHVDKANRSGSYSQTGGTSITLTVSSHNLKVGQSVYLTFSGAIANGLYTVETVTGVDTFTVLSPAATQAGTISADPYFCCVKAYRHVSGGHINGTGWRDLLIISERTKVHSAAAMIQNYAHVAMENLEIVDYDLAGCYGILFENYRSLFSERWTMQNVRWVNTMHGLAFRRNIGSPGTLSCAYGTCHGSYSSAPVGGTGLEIDGADPYGTDWNLNLYQDDDVSATGVNVINGGKLSKGHGLIRGEAAGSSTPNHTFFRVDAASEFRDNQGLSLYSGNGLISISPSATVVNNNAVSVQSLNPQVRLTFDDDIALSARLGSTFNIGAAAWASLTGWTEEQERPSGANNFTGNVFTAPVAGLYRVGLFVSFTPRSTGVTLGARLLCPARNYILGQTITDLRGSDDQLPDIQVGGSHIIRLEAGETITPQAYSSLADAIRASDANGFGTLFSVEYLSS